MIDEDSAPALRSHPRWWLHRTTRPSKVSACTPLTLSEPTTAHIPSRYGANWTCCATNHVVHSPPLQCTSKASTGTCGPWAWVHDIQTTSADLPPCPCIHRNANAVCDNSFCQVAPSAREQCRASALVYCSELIARTAKYRSSQYICPESRRRPSYRRYILN